MSVIASIFGGVAFAIYVQALFTWRRPVHLVSNDTLTESVCGRPGAKVGQQDYGRATCVDCLRGEVGALAGALRSSQDVIGDFVRGENEAVARADSLEAALREARSVLDDIASNYDCDSDAHRHGTRCRECVAKEAVAAIDKAIGVIPPAKTAEAVLHPCVVSLASDTWGWRALWMAPHRIAEAIADIERHRDAVRFLGHDGQLLVVPREQLRSATFNGGPPKCFVNIVEPPGAVWPDARESREFVLPAANPSVADDPASSIDMAGAA